MAARRGPATTGSPAGRTGAEFVRFPDESHELSRSGRPSLRVARFEVILDWFARKL